MKILLTGIAAGATHTFYLAFNDQPILLHVTVHALIFSSGLAAMHFTQTPTPCNAGWYLAGSLHIYLTIHFTIIIGDLSQLMGVNHILLNFLSLP